MIRLTLALIALCIAPALAQDGPTGMARSGQTDPIFGWSAPPGQALRDAANRRPAKAPPIPKSRKVVSSRDADESQDSDLTVGGRVWTGLAIQF